MDDNTIITVPRAVLMRGLPSKQYMLKTLEILNRLIYLEFLAETARMHAHQKNFPQSQKLCRQSECISM